VITVDLQLKGKIPTSAWKYLFLLAALCMGIKLEGDLLGMV
jgi:hypothetical protein